MTDDPAAREMLARMRNDTGYGSVRLQIVDASTGKPLASRVKFETVAGSSPAAEHSSGWSWCGGQITAHLPAGAFLLTVQSSILRPSTKTAFVVKAGKTTELTLSVGMEPIIDPNRRGVIPLAIWLQPPPRVNFSPPLAILESYPKIASLSQTSDSPPDLRLPPVASPGILHDCSPLDVLKILAAESAEAAAVGPADIYADFLAGPQTASSKHPGIILFAQDSGAPPAWGSALVIYNPSDPVQAVRYHSPSNLPFEIFLEARRRKAFSVLYNLGGKEIYGTYQSPLVQRLSDADAGSPIATTFGSPRWLPYLLACGRTFDAVGFGAKVEFRETAGAGNGSSRNAVSPLVRCGSDEERRVWFDVLDSGFRCPAVGVETFPLDSTSLQFTRTMLYPATGEDSGGLKWTAADALDALRAGRSCVTTGPVVYLHLGGSRIPPGVVFSADGKNRVFHIEAMSARRVGREISGVEIIRNGESVRRYTIPPGLDYVKDLAVSLREAEDCWYLFRVVEGGKDAGECLFGPIYFRIPSSRVSPKCSRIYVFGKVSAPDGAPVAGARVVAARDGGLVSETRTDSAGGYRISATLDSRIGAAAAGFEPAETPAWFAARTTGASSDDASAYYGISFSYGIKRLSDIFQINFMLHRTPGD